MVERLEIVYRFEMVYFVMNGNHVKRGRTLKITKDNG
jgi:hypothetical protein